MVLKSYLFILICLLFALLLHAISTTLVMNREFKHLIAEIGHSTSTLKEVEVDFEKMPERLMEKYNINLAEKSLHKLFSALRLKSPDKMKRKTLDRLSLFAGFQNWDELQHTFMGN